MGTGRSIRQWLCKEPWAAYNADDARAGVQGGFLMFWAFAGYNVLTISAACNFDYEIIFLKFSSFCYNQIRAYARHSVSTFPVCEWIS